MRMCVVLFAAMFFVAAACTDNLTQPTTSTDTSPIPTVISADPMGAVGVVERITGSGHYVTPGIGANPDTWRVFTMQALKMADGTVRGSFTRLTHNKGEAPEKATGTITCFTVIGNVAWIGGHLDGADPSDIAWQVVDKGEGRLASDDEVGLQFGPFLFPDIFEAGFAQDFCDETPAAMDFGPPYGVLPLSAIRVPVEAGNIQIDVG